MSKFEIAKQVIDKCNNDQLISQSLPKFFTVADHISYCFNNELNAYGLKTYVSPDKSCVYIDNEGMSQVLSFFDDKTAQPFFTSEHVERIEHIVETANKNKIDLIWLQEGWRKRYYVFKQYGFHGVNIYSILNLNTLNAATAVTSATGAAAMSAAGALALSYSGSLFFSTLENYVPNTFPRTKAAVGITKVVISVPIQIAELTSNAIFGFGENLLTGNKLPTNVTAVFRLDKGLKLGSLTELKKALKNFLLKIAENYL